jgi:uncharacterized MnhB-related membrane protein
MKIECLIQGLTLSAVTALADNSMVDAVIGDVIGGTVIAVIGDKLGDRDDATADAAIVGAVGTAITIDHNGHSSNDHGATR